MRHKCIHVFKGLSNVVGVRVHFFSERCLITGITEKIKANKGKRSFERLKPIVLNSAADVRNAFDNPNKKQSYLLDGFVSGIALPPPKKVYIIRLKI